MNIFKTKFNEGLRFGLLKLIFNIFLITVISCKKEDNGIYFNETREEINIDNVTFSQIEIEIETLLNKYRESKALPSLSSLIVISSVADDHTNYMIQEGKVSHDNFSIRSEKLIINTNAKSVAENLAYGYNSSGGVLAGWLNSDAHKRIIENPNFTHFGISVMRNSEDRNYFTLILIQI